MVPQVSNTYTNPIAPAALVAIDEIRYRHLLDNFDILFNWDELPVCNERVAVEALVNYSRINKKNAEIMTAGMGCDNVCRQMGTLAQAWNNVFGSYACGLIDIASNTNVINTNHLQVDFLAMMNSFRSACGWSTMAIVVSLDANAMSAASQFLDVFGKFNVSMQYYTLDVLTFPNNSAIPDALINLNSVLADIQANTRSK